MSNQTPHHRNHRTEKIEAIIQGMERAEKIGFAKPADVAMFVLTSLDKSGFRVVRKPGS
jgi:S1-C subfamily serine protease